MIITRFRLELKRLLSMLTPGTAKALLQWMPTAEDLERKVGGDLSPKFRASILRQAGVKDVDSLIKWDDVVASVVECSSPTAVARGLRSTVPALFRHGGDFHMSDSPYSNTTVDPSLHPH